MKIAASWPVPELDFYARNGARRAVSDSTRLCRPLPGLRAESSKRRLTADKLLLANPWRHGFGLNGAPQVSDGLGNEDRRAHTTASSKWRGRWRIWMNRQASRPSTSPRRCSTAARTGIAGIERLHWAWRLARGAAGDTTKQVSATYSVYGRVSARLLML